MTLSDRILNHERATDYAIDPDSPLVIRVDGRAFHTLLRDADRPFDRGVMEFMNRIAIKLCEEVDNTKLAYIQSDEISLLVWLEGNAMPWLNHRVQKLASVAASIATAKAVKLNYLIPSYDDITFDARVFPLPHEELIDYLTYRQFDWIRNSVMMLARSHFSQRELQGKKQDTLIEMLSTRGDDWNRYPADIRYGRMCYKSLVRKHVDNEYYQGTVERLEWTVEPAVPFAAYGDVLDLLEQQE